jgi:uncharacterized membrane protein YdjX (TVP38/TMEM64 family)
LRFLRLAVLVAVIASLVATGVWTAFHFDELEPARIAESLRGYGPWTPIAFAVARILGAVVLVPGAVLAIAAGILFGPIWGAVWNVLAATAGAVLVFTMTRFVTPNWAARVVEGHVGLAAMMQAIDEEGWRFVAFVRLVPIFPYNLLNYALGLTNVRVSHYTLATLVCMIPVDLAYAYLGHAGYQALTGQAGALKTALFALGGLAALTFLPAFVRRYRQDRATLIGSSDPSR